MRGEEFGVVVQVSWAPDLLMSQVILRSSVTIQLYDWPMISSGLSASSAPSVRPHDAHHAGSELTCRPFTGNIFPLPKVSILLPNSL